MEDAVRVLDVACGRGQSYVEYEPGWHVTGIDLSPEALESNTELDQRVVGDFLTHPLERGAYGVVLCFDLLEHLPEPGLAIERFATVLAPGGHVILGYPHPLSPKALVAKSTPLWFHVWWYRRVFKIPSAGAPGHGPYRTYLRWSLRPAGLRRMAARAGLDVESLEIETGGDYLARFWARSWRHRSAWTLIRVVWKVLTLGRGDAARTEVRAVLRANGTSDATRPIRRGGRSSR